MTRDELADAIDAAMAASNAAMDRTAQAGLTDSAELAAADNEVARLYVQSLALHAGPAFQRVLCRASMGAAPGEPCPEHGPDTGRAIALLLARFVYDFAPVIGPALPQPVIEAVGTPEGAVQVIVRDIFQTTIPDGSSPVLLPVAKRRKGVKDGRDVIETARQRVVELVYHEAARAQQTLDETWRSLFPKLGETSWNRWKRAVPLSLRQGASADGRNASGPHADLSIRNRLLAEAREIQAKGST